jgi:hypothetical protein
MSKGKVIIGAVGVVVFLAAAYVAAAPYITVYRMVKAAENRNAEVLSEYIDFPSLRQNLKDQLNAAWIKKMAKEAESNPFATLAAPLGAAMIATMVDSLVTPSAITELMRGGKPDLKSGGEGASSSSSRELFSNASMSYESLGKFVITVRFNAVEADSAEKVKFVLRRRGIGWKLTEIILPLETLWEP